MSLEGALRGEEAPSNVGVKGRRQVVMGSRDGVVRHGQRKPRR